ncbi:hypothetical protein [Arboricoccus pini]|uniref:hypothetical protein n=1 Tax=Arboricoccus pini TaxID=1963835 RepID=UPI0010566F34|nr:hypothetical protein [Arboricoccus pini]
MPSIVGSEAGTVCIEDGDGGNTHLANRLYAQTDFLFEPTTNQILLMPNYGRRNELCNYLRELTEHGEPTPTAIEAA